MSSSQNLTQCIQWIAELLRQHTNSPSDPTVEFVSPEEAWIRLPFAPRSIGIRLQPDTLSVTVMACGLALAPSDSSDAHLNFLPGGYGHQHPIEPVYFDGQLYGAWMPINGTAMLGVQLRSDERPTGDCPALLRQWFAAAVRLLK